MRIKYFMKQQSASILDGQDVLSSSFIDGMTCASLNVDAEIKMVSDSGNVSCTMVIEIKYINANHTVTYTQKLNFKLKLNVNNSLRKFKSIMI